MTALPRPNYHLTLPEVLTPAEVAKLFRISPHTLHEPSWERRLQPFRTLGGRAGHRRYRRAVVADVLDWWFR